jgi:membrane fusion protein, multidrug efflux system
MKRIIIVIVLSVMLIAGGFFLALWILHNMRYVSTDDAQVRGNLVGVSSKVAARIIYLGVDNGDKVVKDQVIARLDNRDFKALLAQSEAQAQAARNDEARQGKLIKVLEQEAAQRIGQARDALATSRKSVEISQQDKVLNAETMRANVERQKAALDAARAQMKQAEASKDEADREALRAAHLYKDGAMPLQGKEQAETRQVVSREAVVTARKNMRQQQHLLEIAEANLRTIPVKELQYENARTNVNISDRNVVIAGLEQDRIEVERQYLKTLIAKRKEAEEKVRYNRIILAETTLRAPVEGVIARRNANTGEMTAPGAPLYYVADSHDIWVTANVEEKNIRRVADGAEVDIRVDAFPKRNFRGNVEFVGPVASSELSLFPSDNPSGTFIKIAHRLPVRVKVNNEEGLLKPGMNVVVEIKVH